MKSYEFKTAPKAHPDAVVQGAQYRFTILTDRLFRYEWSEDGEFEDRASTFVVNRELPVPKFRVSDNGDEGLEIVTEHFHLSYDKQRFNSSGLSVNFNSKVTNWGAQWRYNYAGRPGNQGGTARTLDEVDGRCDMSEGIISTEGYAAVDDSHSMLFDGQGWVASRMSGDRIDGYLFGYGHDYMAAIKAFYAISGHQPVLPRWAFGNWWSRYYAYKQQEYIDLMDKFRHKEIPLSVAVIDMDWHLVADKRVPHAGWTGYTWDDKLFPNPEEFGRELHSRNLKITLNDHPHAGVHHHEDSYEAMAKHIGHDTSSKAPILFDPTNKKFMEAYLQILHRNVEKVACDFWWIDWQQGSFSKIPNIDPLWMLNHFHFLDNASSDTVTASSTTGATEKRPLIFSRYAGPGSHRYPVGFSGDTVISWPSLEFQPEFTATASNIGYGWWSHDIGGHMFGSRDDELTARWVQYGVFSPIMRLHSSNSAWGSKEPWCYRKETEEIITSFMQLRHRLVPYLYTLNVSYAAEGLPLVQPLYWHFPEHDEAYSYRNEYFFGFELLVCPIVTPRHRSTNLGKVPAWLPPLGRYVDMFTGTIYDGDRSINLYRPLTQYPVLLHEGSIVILDGDRVPVNGCQNPSAFEVLVAVGRNGQASLLEDPADDSAQSKVEATPTGERGALIQYTQSTGQLTASVTGRTWTFRFLGLTSVPSNLKITLADRDVTSSSQTKVCAYPDTPSLLITVPDPGIEKTQLTIDLGANPSFGIIDQSARILDLLNDMQISYGLKDKIWKIVSSQKSGAGGKVAALLALGVDEDITGPFVEFLLADARSS